MEKASSEEPVQGPPPDGLKLRKLMVNLGNAFVRLTAADRRKVMRLIQHFAFGKNRTVSYWEHWSNDGLKFCCLQMKRLPPLGCRALEDRGQQQLGIEVPHGRTGVQEVA